MKQRQGLVYFDRYEQVIKTEQVYGDRPLRWAYETFLGRCSLEAVIKRKWFSGLYGKWADCSCSSREIKPFMERFNLDANEFLQSVESFSTFNEFFYRRLKPEVRPIAEGMDQACFPADGRHLFIPDLSQSTTIYAKDQAFDLSTLLGEAELANEFSGGMAILSRLCPTDYHRFHFPLRGTPNLPRLINGPLYSVNPIALSRSLSYLWQNKRRVTRIRNSPAGDYLFLEIGATNVGTICDSFTEGGVAEKGAEKGYFCFGGSMVITLLRRNTFQPAEDLATQSERGTELYARFGDRMGTILKAK
ncbi:MAG: phosphatidylserine decarboxylase, partial [Verrucomicrobiota bacterium]